MTYVRVLLKSLYGSRRENIIISYKVTQQRVMVGVAYQNKDWGREVSEHAFCVCGGVCVCGFSSARFRGGARRILGTNHPSHRTPWGGGGPGRHARARKRHATKTGSAGRLGATAGGWRFGRGGGRGKCLGGWRSTRRRGRGRAGMTAGVEACDGGGFAVGTREVYMVVGGAGGGGSAAVRFLRISLSTTV